MPCVFDPLQRQRIFLQPLCPDQLWGPPRILYNGIEGRFRGGKTLPEREADHLPPSSPEIYASSHWRLHGVAGQIYCAFTYLQ
jgi:hypothetical protein